MVTPSIWPLRITCTAHRCDAKQQSGPAWSHPASGHYGSPAPRTGVMQHSSQGLSGHNISHVHLVTLCPACAWSHGITRAPGHTLSCMCLVTLYHACTWLHFVMHVPGPRPGSAPPTREDSVMHDSSSSVPPARPPSTHTPATLCP